MGCMIFRSQLLSAAAFEKAVVLGDPQYFQLAIDMHLFVRHDLKAADQISSI